VTDAALAVHYRWILSRQERAGRQATSGTDRHWLSIVLVLIILAGCGESTIGVVSGTVTVDGLPAKEGSIAFFPVDRKSATAGAEIREGEYTAQVPLGASKVEIRVPKVVGQRKLYNTSNSPIMPLLEESLPAKYNDQTELTLDVRPGKNRQDYQLSTK
jgi:hypothetical protein